MGEALDRLRRRMNPLTEGQYLIGISGGADSVALLYLLLPDIRDGRIKAEAVHVNHGLRGESSDGDETFTRELCRREGIPFRSFRADLGEKRSEAAARDARAAFFRREMAETAATGMILAHQADDQAETFMMRLLRGAGPEGLSCMKEDDTSLGFRIIRPMLRLRRQEIREALREEGIAWREDGTNEDRAYLRNRVRLELIPQMEAIEPGAAEKICRAARLIGEDQCRLEAEAETLLRQAEKGDLLDTEKLSAMPGAILNRVLRRWWEEQGPALRERSLSERQTAELARLTTANGGTTNLPGGYRAVRGSRFLHLVPPQKESLSPVKFSAPVTRFGGIELTVTDSEGDPGDGRRTQEVPEGFTEGCEIRTRKPGDRIRPFGSGGSRKLQDYLTDRKVDEPFRDRIPLLCRGNEVLLAAGIGAGQIPDWHDTGRHVRLTWHGNMPWID